MDDSHVLHVQGGLSMKKTATEGMPPMDIGTLVILTLVTYNEDTNDR